MPFTLPWGCLQGHLPVRCFALLGFILTLVPFSCVFSFSTHILPPIFGPRVLGP